MGEAKDFLKYRRQEPAHRSVAERVLDFRTLDMPLTPGDILKQAARCMDCGVPFCHGAGCPLKNIMPELNELVYKDRWRQACDLLHSTNNFPEITGRICPAPCETACTLAINDDPVLIRHIEYSIVERGFAEGWIQPLPAAKKSGRSVAVLGSGPAGLAAAQQLARAGHTVTVFEKGAKAGGILRYGIPDFKLEKKIIDRRLDQLSAEGVEFQTGVDVGKDISANYLHKMFDCICLTIGSGQPRDLAVAGRGYENVLFAMDYLTGQNRINCGESANGIPTARDKNVAVIGGGDTGSDCVGTARRQGAKKIYQLEILPEPPDAPPADTPWPMWPRIMRTTSSHEEGCERIWSAMTKKLSGTETYVSELYGGKVEWLQTADGWKMKELPGSDFTIKTELVLLALGFLHPVHEGIIKDLGIELDRNGNVMTNNCRTNVPEVFAAGDAVSGASLVVKAINSARDAAEAINAWLK